MSFLERKNLAIDIIIFVLYLVVANPALTGISVHEWLGLGLFVSFFIHVEVHADWIVETLRSVFSHPSCKRTGNAVLDICILVAFMATTVSGIMVSGTVLPLFGLYAEGYYFWDPMHAVAAKVLLALLILHIILHWKWIANALKRKKRHR